MRIEPRKVVESRVQQSRGGPGLLTLLTVLFVGLKLTEEIDWSWWWVLAPTWIPLAVLLLFVAGLGILFLVAELMVRRQRARNIKRRQELRERRYEGPS